VASDKDTLCFVEVKARSGYRFGAPSEAVSRAKQRQISKAALVFLKEKKLLDRKARFDVVCVEEAAEAPRLSLVKNAFELSEDFTY
jgi:putative endonuclease